MYSSPLTFRRTVISSAMDDVMQKSCVVFEPRKGDEYHVEFVTGDSDTCWSYVGRVAGESVTLYTYFFMGKSFKNSKFKISL